jgi:phospholipase/carboxylesterase
MPLVVILHGGGGDSHEQMDWMREFAEKNDMIMLVPTATAPGRWDVIYNYAGQGDGEYPDVKNIDAAMKQVLRKYAIAPDRIALAGMSDGGSYSLFLGRANMDIFSRIAPLSPSIYYNEPGPQNSQTQFFLAGGLLEGGSGFFSNPIQVAHELRQTRNPAKQVLMLRPH